MVGVLALATLLLESPESLYKVELEELAMERFKLLARQAQKVTRLDDMNGVSPD